MDAAGAAAAELVGVSGGCFVAVPNGLAPRNDVSVAQTDGTSLVVAWRAGPVGALFR